MDISLLIKLDAASELPLHRQLYQQIRAAILTGRLKPQTRLPASRQLAKTLAVSRTTVIQSYDQLISEGYLQTKLGAGTFVCSQIPDNLLLTPDRPRREDLSVEPSASKRFRQASLGLTAPVDLQDRLSSYGRRLLNTADYKPEIDCSLSFRYGLPDLSLFPWTQWRRLLNRQAASGKDWMGYGADPMGHEGLRQEIAAYMSDVRAVRCSSSQILITGGTQQALSLISQVLMDVGEAIAFEDPGYLSAKRIFSARGAVILPVPVDDSGIKIDGPNGLAEKSVDKAFPQPHLVYVTPSHQFPLGVLMPLSRRLALLRWAKANKALIVEDDYDSEFRYSGSPIPALQGLDDSGCVLYVGTFSKVMFPGLRLGYIVLPPTLIDVFRRAKWLCDRQCSLLEQAALAEFIQSGSLAAHIRRMRTVYERRRCLLIEALRQAVPDVVIPGDASGLHILARWQCRNVDRDRNACLNAYLNAYLLERSLIRRAKEQDVGLFSAWPHYWRSRQPPSNQNNQTNQTSTQAPLDSAVEVANCELIFGFGNITEGDIESAIARVRPFFQAR